MHQATLKRERAEDCTDTPETTPQQKKHVPCKSEGAAQGGGSGFLASVSEVVDLTVEGEEEVVTPPVELPMSVAYTHEVRDDTKKFMKEAGMKNLIHTLFHVASEGLVDPKKDPRAVYKNVMFDHFLTCYANVGAPSFRSKCHDHFEWPTCFNLKLTVKHMVNCTAKEDGRRCHTCTQFTDAIKECDHCRRKMREGFRIGHLLAHFAHRRFYSLPVVVIPRDFSRPSWIPFRDPKSSTLATREVEARHNIPELPELVPEAALAPLEMVVPLKVGPPPPPPALVALAKTAAPVVSFAAPPAPPVVPLLPVPACAPAPVVRANQAVAILGTEIMTGRQHQIVKDMYKAAPPGSQWQVATRCGWFQIPHECYPTLEVAINKGVNKIDVCKTNGSVVEISLASMTAQKRENKTKTVPMPMVYGQTMVPCVPLCGAITCDPCKGILCTLIREGTVRAKLLGLTSMQNSRGPWRTSDSLQSVLKTGKGTSLLPALSKDFFSGVLCCDTGGCDSAGGGGGGSSSTATGPGVGIRTVSIPKGSTLFDRVQHAANSSQPIGQNIEVLEVCGVVNPRHMESYLVERQAFEHQGLDTECIAWHGTGKNPTLAVATSDVGLHPLYCPDGSRKYFGSAVYVSSLLFYTHERYAERTRTHPLAGGGSSESSDAPTPTHKVILCHVLPGKAEPMQTKQTNFGLPQLKQLCADRGDKIHSSSVVCAIDNTIMRALYQSAHVYPTFVVTYRTHPCYHIMINTPPEFVKDSRPEPS